MKTVGPATLVLVALVAMGALVGWPRGATAEKPGGCLQWEIMVAAPSRLTIDTKSLPEAGKPFIEPAPPGWEPFAFTPGGQLVYRRCGK